ncbi:MAG TPA: hypothetical protein VGF22_23715 [Acidimicrobiales bacterium]|jgi:hypothetical protein
MKASGLIAGGALVALLLAGCGGDNSASVSSATTSGASSATTSGDNSSATTASSTASSDASTTTPSFKGDANSDFCNAAKDIASGDLANALSGDNPDLKAGFQKASDALAKAKDTAPSEIKQDVVTVADAFKKYSDFLAQYDYDIAKLTAAAQKDPKVLQQATEGLSDPKIDDANNRIVAYAEQVCGITTSTS